MVMAMTSIKSLPSWEAIMQSVGMRMRPVKFKFPCIHGFCIGASTCPGGHSMVRDIQVTSAQKDLLPRTSIFQRTIV
ncbi:hypothetical protein F2P79_008524 [Pimephales promelas]|nr:hypothetical protein F2P79_008524 [Pimephales promelas]